MFVSTIRIVLGFASVYAFVTALAGCGSDSGGSGGASCASVCERITAAHCANDPDCMSQCAAAKKATPAGCTASYDALAGCFSTATFTCDDNQQSVADACKSKEGAWQACIDGGSPDPGPGGGGSGGKGAGGNGAGGRGSGGSSSGATCNGRTATTPCDACVARSCCDTLMACQADGDCLKLAGCVNGCSDDDCVQACADAAPQAAVDLYNESITCANDHCESECSGSAGSGGSTGTGGSTGSSQSGIGAPNDGNTGSGSPTTPADCLPIPTDVTGYCGDVKYKVIYDCPNGQPYSDCVFNTMDSSGIYCCGH
jgi:hypothetical protein